MPTVMVDAADRTYAVEIQRGLLAQVPDRLAALGAGAPVFVISDTAVAPRYGFGLLAALRHRGLRASFLAVPGREASKQLASLPMYYESLAGFNMPRDGLIVALGGGMITDLAGFVAATWMRGVRWVPIPTTLLGMVDAAIGGKVAINHHGTTVVKNLIGAFHQPEVVLADPDVLATLPPEQFQSGLAEVVKAACLDAASWRWLTAKWEGVLANEGDQLDAAILRSVRIKAAIVSEDPWERSGVRRRLNLGHTLGHALEGYWEGDVPHGLCVAAGLCFAAQLGVALQVTKPDYARMIERLAETLLPDDPWPVWAELLEFLGNDKKQAADGTLRWVLPVEPGVTEEVMLPVTAELLLETWERCRERRGG
ncbi:MAG: 3-dehydroquinate synthase family protein [bacterium]